MTHDMDNNDDVKRFPDSSFKERLKGAVVIPAKLDVADTHPPPDDPPPPKDKGKD